MITKIRKTEKRSLGSIFLFIFLVIFVSLIIGFLFVANLNLYQKGKELNRDKVSLERKIEDLERENRELKLRTSQVSKEEYSEKMLREKGMYKKPGEGVVVVTKGIEEKGESRGGEDNFKKSSSVASASLAIFASKVKSLLEKL